MNFWFSNQGDRTLLSKSNDMLQRLFLAIYKGFFQRKKEKNYFLTLFTFHCDLNWLGDYSKKKVFQNLFEAK